MATTSDPSKLADYDVEALVRTFDILRAAGNLDEFIKECKTNEVKIYVDPKVAAATRSKLVAAMPGLRADPDRFAAIFGRAPHLMVHAPDECPACPRG
ncbi:MAG: hypothetical protein QOF14_767 [Hyphomicrobiales bacterium]|jgi:hypothetical protein|nr:hypothetical protein [Hyphomicrobiales bacterium]